MTDRIRKLIVILDQDYRDDDAESIANAIDMIKGVAQVELGEAVSYEEEVNRREFRRSLGYIVSELAIGNDSDFLSEVRSAYEKLKNKRGY